MGQRRSLLKDQGCLRDFISATATGGLEFRKKIAELISFDCGFAIDEGIRAGVLLAPARIAKIIIVKQDLEEGDEGWVPTSWLVYSRTPPSPKLAQKPKP